MDIEMCPCLAGNETMIMRAQVKRSEGHGDCGDCEEGRDSRCDRGGCTAPCREAWRRQSVQESEEMGSRLCTCHLGRMMPLPLVQTVFLPFRELMELCHGEGWDDPPVEPCLRPLQPLPPPLVSPLQSQSKSVHSLRCPWQYVMSDTLLL